MGAMDDAVTVRDAAGADRARQPGGARAARRREPGRRSQAIGMAGLWERFALYTDGRPPGRRRRPARPGAAAASCAGSTAAPASSAGCSPAQTTLHDDDGAELVMNVTEDVTAVRRAELGQRLLVEAGRLLSATTDLAATLQQVAELDRADARRLVRRSTCPAPGGWLQPGRGRARRSGARSSWPTGCARATPSTSTTTARRRARDPHGRAACGSTASRPRCCATPPPDAEHLALLEALGLSALLVVPLRSGDDVLGALTLVASQPHRRFDDADRGGRGRARAADRRRAAQRRGCSATAPRSRTCSPPGCAPTPSPVLPGLRGRGASTARRARTCEAGGDFYDVIDAPSGSIVVMGDVVGKGAPAAALSAVVARDAADGGAPDRRSARGAGRAQPHAAPARRR